MSAEEEVLRLLRDNNLIAFIGAGASRSIYDGSGKSLYRGLPDARGLVQAMSDRVNDILPEMPFEDAAFLFRKTVGDRQYREFFEERIDPPDIAPLPAHRCLAVLPFTCYVSMNFDRLLERALTEFNQDFQAVITEKDFYAPNILRRRIVLKPHGCISQFETIVASTDQVTPYPERLPLIDSLLRVLLTNTPVLFIGFGLKDADFRMLIQTLRKSVKNLPRSFAIAPVPTRFDREFWSDHSIDLIDADLTEFLTGLAAQFVGENLPIHLRKAGVDFLNDPIFSQISTTGIPALPTETQVTEAFLDGINSRLARRDQDLSSLLAEAKSGAEHVMSARMNYRAFRRVADQTIEAIETAGATSGNRSDAYEAFQKIRRRRATIADRIRANGQSVIKEGDKLLLYSQSVRVAELLKSIDPFIQNTCEIFIAECRPKSPRMFFDAVFFADALLNSKYHIHFVPDVAMTTLIGTCRVSKVLLGAHAIYVDDAGRLTGFVNTCGSLQLALACEKFSVPIFVIAESDKFERGQGRPQQYSEEQEERLEIKNDIGLAPKVFRQLSKIPITNIGYDYVSAQSNITLISD